MAFSRLEDETTQGRDEQIAFLTFVLEVFEKMQINVVANIGDKCNLCQPLLLACSEKITSVEDSTIAAVHQLITKLRTPIMSARLRRETALQPNIMKNTG